MFFLALGATLSDTGHGAPAASLFANLHPQNAQASAHTVFFLFFNVSFIDPFARGKMRILA